MRIKRKRQYREVEPDEILIDAQNLPGFDSSRLEGRIERPIESKIFRNFLLALGALVLVFTLQLAKLQIVDADSLRERAEANRLAQSVLIAERGYITDRSGEPLALNEWKEELGFSVRNYPLGEAASHVVGYVSYPKRDDNGYWFQESSKGLAGIEAFFDDALRGQNGVELKETSAVGEEVSGSIVRIPHDGEEITLSLDAGLQKALYEAIKTRADESGFIGGSGVVMDITTGELYALVSYPSYDPEVLSSGGPREIIQGYVADSRSPFLDRAISGLYTPGSVVKPLVAVAALEENIIDPNTKLYSSGSITVPNPYNPSNPAVFRDWKAHGWVDIRDAISVSSDVYFYAVGGGLTGETAQDARVESQEGLGISTIEAYMRRFGIASATGVPLEGEAVGVIPTPSWKADTFDGERWFLGNTYHTSIGQYGFQVTAIQLARAIAAIAGGGTLVDPSLLAHTSGKKTSLNIDDANLQVVREGRHQVVEEGTALAINFSDFEIAAKTGTAEVGVNKEFVNSLIVGFFPYENPRFAFATVMERGKAGTASGAPAAMRAVFEWLITERPEMTK